MNSSFYGTPFTNRNAQSPMIAVPRSSVSDLPQPPVIGPGQSSIIAGGQSPMIGPGRSSVIARRESIESSSEEIQVEENQAAKPTGKSLSSKSIDDDLLHRRKELDHPEQDFLL